MHGSLVAKLLSAIYSACSFQTLILINVGSRFDPSRQLISIKVKLDGRAYSVRDAVSQLRSTHTERIDVV
jgi:hypothetical protein